MHHNSQYVIDDSVSKTALERMIKIRYRRKKIKGNFDCHFKVENQLVFYGKFNGGYLEEKSSETVLTFSYSLAPVILTACYNETKAM